MRYDYRTINSFQNQIKLTFKKTNSTTLLRITTAKARLCNFWRLTCFFRQLSKKEIAQKSSQQTQIFLTGRTVGTAWHKMATASISPTSGVYKIPFFAPKIWPVFFNNSNFFTFSTTQIMTFKNATKVVHKSLKHLKIAFLAYFAKNYSNCWNNKRSPIP